MGFLSFQRKVESWTPLGFYIEDKEKGATIVQIEAGSLAESIGLKTKDVIVEVNGIKSSSSDLKKLLLSEKKGSKIVVLRNDKLLYFDYIPPEKRLDIPHLVFSFMGSFFLLIGLFTYFKEISGESFLFALIMIFSFVLFSVYPSGKINDLWRSLFAFRTIGSFLIFPLIVHFFSSFTKFVRTKNLLYYGLLYLPGIILSFLFIDGLLLGGKIFIGEEKIPFLYNLRSYYIFIFAFLLLFILIFQSLKIKKPYQQRRWKIGLYGLLGIIPYVFFEIILKEFGYDSGIPLWILSIFMLLLPLSYSAAISRYRLKDIYNYLINTFYFLIFVFIGFFLYIIFNLILANLFGDKFKASQNFFLFIFGFIIAYLLYLYRKKIFAIADKVFGTNITKIQEEILSFSKEIAFYKEPNKLIKDLLSKLKATFSLNYANYYSFRNGNYEIFQEDKVLPKILDEEGIKKFQKKFSFLYLELKNFKIGAIVIGEKEDGLPLSLWEISLIKNLLTPLSFYFQNLNLLKELEDKLEKLSYSEKFLETIFTHSPLGLLVLDKNGEILRYNPSAKEILKIEKDFNFFKTFPKLKYQNFESQFFNLNEKTLLITQAIFPFKAKEENHIIFINDLTEKVNLQEALKEKEKMAILGQFASTIAHELNTPLTAIYSYAQFLEKTIPKNSPEYKKFYYIYKESFHMSELINTLLEFSKSGKGNYKICPFKEIIQNTLSSMAPLLEEKGFEIFVEDNTDFLIRTDPILFERALFNILLNSCEAVNFSGYVSVYWNREGDYLKIFIEDDGPGIPEDLKDRVFEPFFSKKLGRGIGLGLTLTYAIIKSMGGNLYFKERKGRGTITIIEVPYEYTHN